MARAVTPKVNRTVTYYDASGKPKPAVTTGVVSGTTVNLRIGHPTAVTLTSKILGNRNPASVRTDCWMVK